MLVSMPSDASAKIGMDARVGRFNCFMTSRLSRIGKASRSVSSSMPWLTLYMSIMYLGSAHEAAVSKHLVHAWAREFLTMCLLALV